MLEAAQMGPFGPTPRRAQAALGCFAAPAGDGDDDVVGEAAEAEEVAAEYRAEFHAMLGTGQGLTLIHYSAQRKQNLWDTLGA